MQSVVEIKARVRDVDKLLNNVLKFADTSVGTELLQEDTFFNVNRGRLKLRQFKVLLGLLPMMFILLLLLLRVLNLPVILPGGNLPVNYR